MNDQICLAMFVSMVAACGAEPARDLAVKTTIHLEPGEERYECYRVNVSADIFASAFSTPQTPGVHHQVLAVVADQTAPEGTTTCPVLALDSSNQWVFESSSGAQSLTMPKGVAYPVYAGSQLLLQMHLINSGDASLDSTVEIDLHGSPEAEVQSHSQLVAAGSLNIQLPPGQATTVSSKCTLSQPVSVFAVLPHMHALGKTFRTWIDGQASMLVDGPFLQDGQLVERFDPVELPAGTPLDVECNYFNTTSATVQYGPTAASEMCFALTYFYPAVANQGAVCLH